MKPVTGLVGWTLNGCLLNQQRILTEALEEWPTRCQHRASE